MKLFFLICSVALAQALLPSIHAPSFSFLKVISPKLAKYLVMAHEEPEKLVEALRTSPLAQMAPKFKREYSEDVSERGETAGLPIVVTHGMGDSCFNPGMKQITAAAGTHKGVYSVCIPGGDNQGSDTMSGFFVTMDKNVDIFAEKVKKDPKLANGFDAIGLSQGNSVIRGYIQRYNNPPVNNYISVHGTVMGVAGFPQCNPSGLLGPVCDILDEALGTLAYTDVIQDHLFQANYFRDPKRVTSQPYLEHSAIAQWNNEKTVNATYKSNFETVKKWVMIRAMGDTMVYPNIGEWWGEYTPGQFKVEQNITQTPLFEKDLFGLKTVFDAGKVFFNSTKGNHLQFTEQELFSWIDFYL